MSESVENWQIINGDLHLKPNHDDFPLSIFQNPADKKEFIALVETFNKNYDLNQCPERYNELVNFIVSIAEPRSRPQYIHEYVILDATLKSATQVGFTIAGIRENLHKYSKYQRLPPKLDDILVNLESSKSVVSISLHDSSHYVVRLPATFPRDLKDCGNDENAQKIFAPSHELFMAESATDEYFGLFQQAQRFTKRLVSIGDISTLREILQSEVKRVKYAVIEEYFLHTGIKPPSDFIKIDTPSNFHLPNDYIWQYRIDLDNNKPHSQTIHPNVIKAFDNAYKFIREAPLLQADLKSTTQLRTYQTYAVSRIVNEQTVTRFGSTINIKKLNSGMVVLPCGSGKSLQGIATACRIGRACLIVTNSNLSNKQWRDQFLQFSTIDESRIFVFHASEEDKQTRKMFTPGYHTVFIATYNMLTGSVTKYASVIRQLLKVQCWGIVLFDEAHLMFAKTFKTLFKSNEKDMPDNFIRSYCKVGLTATPLREDDKMKLIFLLGCKLFESNWADLTKQGYIADLNCVQVNCGITRFFYEKYIFCMQKRVTDMYDYNWYEKQLKAQKEHVKNFNNQSVLDIKYHDTASAQFRHLNNEWRQHQDWLVGVQTQAVIPPEKPVVDLMFLNTIKGNLPIFNPEKLRMASMLKNYHVAQGHQVLLFCDSVVAAEMYAKLLKIPFVDGDVGNSERQLIVETFLERKINCFMLTRVGDTSLDLPDANVLIEIDWQDSSKRQETQRIGRISRPKGSGQQGFFYILVSEATDEVSTSTNRRTYFTQNQGYSYSSIDDTEIVKYMKDKKVEPDATVGSINEVDYYHEIIYQLWQQKQKK